MAGGLFALLDDIALLLDDAAVYTKVAAKKSAAVLGDDLAVNAEKAAGFASSRELPVVWAISKGSLLNKIIILPLAFLLSAFMPQAIVPILLLGGAYLSFEGVEKIAHSFFGHDESNDDANALKNSDPTSILAVEKVKIRGAILTDFILSIEIIMIALGSVMDQSFQVQLISVSIVAILATIGVYGLVAVMVRLDDMGLALYRRFAEPASFVQKILRELGLMMARSMPLLIRSLSVIGTIAMLLVGGGMFLHNLDAVHHVFAAWPPFVPDFLIGLVVGAVALLLVSMLKKVIPEK